MAGGGFRRNAGRPKGSRNKHKRKDAGVPRKKTSIIPGLIQPQVMPTDIELIPGLMTRRRVRPNPDATPATITEQEKTATPPVKTVRKPQGKLLSALEYAQQVFNDPDADPERRDRMALNALPFMHVKPGDIAKAEVKPKGKKEIRQDIADEAAANGKFAVPAGPKLVLNNT